MDKKSKIFFSVLFSIIFIVAVFSFYKFYILKDYYIMSEADCDPATEKCFIYECDPVDDSECPENPDERISYYKFIEKKASAIPVCDPNGSDCPPLICQAGEDCTETLCDEATKTEDEQCSDPSEYLKNQKESGKSSECITGDENCPGEVSDQENIDSESLAPDNFEVIN